MKNRIIYMKKQLIQENVVKKLYINCNSENKAIECQRKMKSFLYIFCQRHKVY